VSERLLSACWKHCRLSVRVVGLDRLADHARNRPLQGLAAVKAGRPSTTMSALEERLPKPRQQVHGPSCPKCFEFLRLTHTILDPRHAKTVRLYGCRQCDVQFWEFEREQ
jgi:hypothetical protein